MTWASIALTLLKVVSSIIDFLNSKKLMDAGADREVAKASLAILNKTRFAKETIAKINAMDDAEVDELLKRLEG